MIQSRKRDDKELRSIPVLFPGIGSTVQSSVLRINILLCSVVFSAPKQVRENTLHNSDIYIFLIPISYCSLYIMVLCMLLRKFKEPV